MELEQFSKILCVMRHCIRVGFVNKGCSRVEGPVKPKSAVNKVSKLGKDKAGRTQRDVCIYASAMK